MQHIPGPWLADGQTVKAVSHGQWFKIARAENPKITTEAHKVTAKLMAAAPELLSCLQLLAHNLEALKADGYIGDGDVIAIRAALAKAS